jgi:hypothetical protein
MKPAGTNWSRGGQLPVPVITILGPGRLAQLEERLPYKQEVTGSSPVPPI